MGEREEILIMLVQQVVRDDILLLGQIVIAMRIGTSWLAVSNW